MPKILAPNKQYSGVTASVPFENGVGHCNDPYLLDWFRQQGYQVVEEAAPKKSEGKKAEAPKAADSAPAGQPTVSTETPEPGSEQ